MPPPLPGLPLKSITFIGYLESKLQKCPICFAKFAIPALENKVQKSPICISWQQIARSIINQLSLLTESYHKREVLRSIYPFLFLCKQQHLLHIPFVRSFVQIPMTHDQLKGIPGWSLKQIEKNCMMFPKYEQFKKWYIWSKGELNKITSTRQSSPM